MSTRAHTELPTAERPITVSSSAADAIIVRGARTHNLKNIDVEIPHNLITVITGVSGSGKSSLAFDTIYAEGQRRYVESLSAYARQFLERIEKPDADLIDGIAPAIAIRQKNSTRNPRSTVATATEIYDYLRLLYARIGHTFCLVCGNEVKRDTVDEVAAAVLALGNGTRLNVTFPLLAHTPPVVAKDESSAPQKRAAKKVAANPQQDARQQLLKDKLFELRKRGFNRLLQNGNIYEFSTPESLLEIDFAQPVSVLVDRIVVSADARARIVDAAEIGYRESGEVLYETVPRAADDGSTPESQRLRFSGRFECKQCHIRYDEPEPRLFSFNNPYGACPRCQGFGNTIDFDLNLVIPDPTLSLDEGAIDPWTKPQYRGYQTELKRWAKQRGVPTNKSWCDLDAEHQQLVLNGEGRFPGIHGFFDYLERKKYKLHVRVFLSRYRGYATCPECKGQRLRAEARAVRIRRSDSSAWLNICDATALTVEDARTFFDSLRLSTAEAEIADKILQEVRDRLKFLFDVGLDYLTLDRLSATLSGGESQRIQLATSLGSRLVGALYVLDEPSIGLHARDTARLVHILHELRDLGNTILVVEHDPDVMSSADHILDMGPGAGEHGGRLMSAGNYEHIANDPHSLTGKYLSGHLAIQIPPHRREPNARRITLRGVRANNIKGLDVSIPLGMLVAITGVSGSGKSTLIHDVLYKALSASKGVDSGEPADAETVVNACKGLFKKIEGEQNITDVVLVDQSPIGRTPRSNPVTYIKAFDAIRELFASQPESKKRGFSAGHFSFNVPGGRCETCEGDGTVTVEMQFLADVELVCEECHGTRYKATVLDVKYKGKNIHDVLNLTVREALQFFHGVPKIQDKLRTLEEVGLGYLRLGQSASTLSGGEAQRMKLAAHLGTTRSQSARMNASVNGDSENPDQHEARRRFASRPLYIFDEPTTGLHFDDVSKLLAAFRRLIQAGGSVLVIEHNLDVIKTADWIIDMGPDGGTRGGKIVAEGTPEHVAQAAESFTGQWLQRVLPQLTPSLTMSNTRG